MLHDFMSHSVHWANLIIASLLSIAYDSAMRNNPNPGITIGSRSPTTLHKSWLLALVTVVFVLFTVFVSKIFKFRFRHIDKIRFLALFIFDESSTFFSSPTKFP
jgi:hypothetical protein